MKQVEFRGKRMQRAGPFSAKTDAARRNAPQRNRLKASYAFCAPEEGFSLRGWPRATLLRRSDPVLGDLHPRRGHFAVGANSDGDECVLARREQRAITVHSHHEG